MSVPRDADGSDLGARWAAWYQEQIQSYAIEVVGSYSFIALDPRLGEREPTPRFLTPSRLRLALGRFLIHLLQAGLLAPGLDVDQIAVLARDHTSIDFNTRVAMVRADALGRILAGAWFAFPSEPPT